MKFFLFIFLVLHGLLVDGSVSKCEQTARDQAAKKIKECKSIAIRNNERRGAQLIRNFRTQIQEFETEKRTRMRNVCEKAKTIYEPTSNGLISEIPPNWGCQIDETMQKVWMKLREQRHNIDNSSEAFNIVLVGRSGAGKSYFGNALLGILEPGKREGVPFPVYDDLYVTRNVYAQNGKLFGGLYDKELGLTKSLSINVFDTPGFSDANIENIRKNKLLISSAIKHQIHMIIYLVGPRFDANIQLSLQMLNEWIAGHMWRNLVVLKGRTSFEPSAVDTRSQNGNTMSKLKDNSKIVEYVSTRSDRLNAWT